MIKNALTKLTILLLIVFSYSCANMVPPSGGPKDTTPPQPVKISPPLNTKNFKEKTIEIKFNEFIVLKNLNDNLVFSPPSREKPKVRLNGKKLIITLPDSLLPNTTYIINFGNSIADFTEGNILHNFKYVFSTGEVLDSLKISGNVYDAYTLDPEKNIDVLLFPANRDSFMSNGLPYYITLTDKKGHFEFTNIKKGEYSIYALVDKNKNYKYDLPTEKIGFSDTVIVPFAKIITDTSGRKYTVTGPDSIILHTFTESRNIKNFVKDYKRIMPGKLLIVFNTEQKTKPEIMPLKDFAYIPHISEDNDSIIIWITDTNITKNDTVAFAVSYTDRDTLRQDTLYFKWFKKRYKLPPFKVNISGSNKISPFNPLTLSLSYPAKETDTTKIFVYHKIDTTFKKVPYQLKKKLDKLIIDFDRKEGESYKIVMDSCAVTSIFGSCNDSIALNFSIRSKDYYGSLEITPSDKVLHNYIIELTDKSLKKLLRRKIITPASPSVSFERLEPGNYSLRIISDKNNNGQWDPGNLTTKTLPENVSYEKNIKIKSSWTNSLKINFPQ